MRKNTPPADILQALHDARKLNKSVTLNTNDITDLITYRRLAQDAHITIKFNVVMTLTPESIPEEPETLIEHLAGTFQDEQEDETFSSPEKQEIARLVNNMFAKKEKSIGKPDPEDYRDAKEYKQAYQRWWYHNKKMKKRY